MTEHSHPVTWHRIGPVDMLEQDSVTTVMAGSETLCLTHTENGYGAICNRCPHQGGPLGDGFIENGYVICPWHAYEYDPQTGSPPGGYDDAAEPFAVETRADGVYVGIVETEKEPTLMDQMIGVMTDWGVDTVFGMVGHSNLGVAEAFYNTANVR